MKPKGVDSKVEKSRFVYKADVSAIRAKYLEIFSKGDINPCSSMYLSLCWM
jgi:hypothetical protein